MIRSKRFCFILGLALLQAACAPVPRQAPPHHPPMPSRPRGERPAEPAPPSESRAAPGTEPKPPAPRKVVPARGQSAVLALMQDADASTKKGDLENAATTLERAIRIQSRNAGLWLRLADIRLRQQQPGLAEDLARKALTLAGGAPDMTRESWRLIAEARRRQGDAAGAAEADQRAAE